MPRVYQTIRGVPLAKVGDWPVYRGNGRITREDLADVVAAAQDPEVRDALDGDPRGWLGHIDGADAAQARQDEPCIGRIMNLRLSDDGNTLIGDTEDIPDGIPEHYPRRSVELAPNVTTGSGRRYRKVLSGLAFLGRTRGAIRGLGALDDIAKAQRPTLAALSVDGELTLCALPDEETDPNGTSGALDETPDGSTVGGMTKPTGTKPDEKPDEGAPLEGTPPEGTDKPDGNNVETPDEKPEGGGTPNPDGPETVTITKNVYDGLVGRLDELERKDKARTTSDQTTERDTAIAAAIKDEQIAPADKDSTVALFAKHGHEAGMDWLRSLPKGKSGVPLGEIGANAADDEPIDVAEFASDQPLPDDVSILRHVRKPNRSRKAGR